MSCTANSAITAFRGAFAALSNFHPALITVDGVEFPTLEHAYVAAKFHDTLIRQAVLDAATPGRVKRLGRKHADLVRPDWDDIRLDVMAELLEAKFAHADLASILVATGTAELVEGNDWHDTFWGRCTGCVDHGCDGVGDNHLGRLLMSLRGRLSQPAAKQLD